MKNFLIALFAVMFVILLGVAIARAQQSLMAPALPCPKTKMMNSCLTCHTIPDFKLKEQSPDGHLTYPIGVRILDYGTPAVRGYFELNDISEHPANQVRDYFNYLRKHHINHAMLEIFSPGGSLFSGWKIKGLIDEWKIEGRVCQTIVHGIAASAGALVFLAGSDGYRTMNMRGELMFHELAIFKFLSLESPSDKEDETRILRHLQDNMSSWLAKRSKLSKEEWDQRMRKREFWVDGTEAKRLGIADIIIGD